MNQRNQIILKMVLASPVGQALSDADREALKQTLETTDAREVRGWLGEQIRKAAVIAKGDYDGHPFRGNQYADASGASTGGASGSSSRGLGEPRRRGKDIDDLSAKDQDEYVRRMGAARTRDEQKAIIREFQQRGLPTPQPYGSGASTGNLKEGDFADIDTKTANYVGTILRIKDGVVTFDDEDKGEIKFKLENVRAIDGNDIEDDSAKVNAKENADEFMRGLSSLGRRMVRSADKTQEGFDRAKEELDALESSRDQIIQDLVNEDGMSQRRAQRSIDDEIEVARFAVENSKFNDADKPEDDSAKAGRERIRAIEAREKEIARATERSARERVREDERRKTLTPVTEDNIDKPLKGDEAKEFKSNLKDAQTAVKTTRALIAQLRLKANDKAMRSRLGPEGVDRVQMNLQEAQEETDRFENILNDNSKASIRSAVSISAMGTDVGEIVKGAIRESAEFMKIDIMKINDSALQDAGDRNFGVSGDKYDVESVYDKL